MNRSIIKSKLFRRILVVIFWLLVWEIASRIIHQDILLASPAQVAKTLAEYLFQADFWQTIFYSFIRILVGFGSAVLLGICLAVLASTSEWIQTLLHLPMTIIKSTPVASFIIIVLLWFGSKWLSSIISFLMVLPVIYSNTLQGILQTDQKLLEMAQVFRIPLKRKVKAIYLYDVMPYFVSSLTISLGLAWKSGVAAEVIGLPSGSIGEKLYQAKIFLSSADLIAWTITIILISFLFERVVLKLVQNLQQKLES